MTENGYYHMTEMDITTSILSIFASEDAEVLSIIKQSVCCNQTIIRVEILIANLNWKFRNKLDVSFFIDIRIHFMIFFAFFALD